MGGRGRRRRKEESEEWFFFSVFLLLKKYRCTACPQKTECKKALIYLILLHDILIIFFKY